MTKQKLHPAVVGIALLFTVGLLFVFYMRASNSAEDHARTPPPEVMKAYEKQGKALFPSTIPGKHGGTLNLSTQNAKPVVPQ